MVEDLVLQDVIGILPLFIVVCLMIISLVSTIVLCMARYSNNSLTPINLPGNSQLTQIINNLEPWAIEHGFKWVGTFKSIGNTKNATWQLILHYFLTSLASYQTSNNFVLKTDKISFKFPLWRLY